MALHADIIWEMRSTALETSSSNNNGGGFKAGASGTDYSHASLPANGAPHLSFTDLETKNADYDRVYSATHNASMVAGCIGNIIHVTAGTNFTAGWYEVTGNGDGGGDGLYLDIDRNCASANSNDGVAALGGCLALPTDAFFEQWTAGNKLYIKNSTYALTANVDVAKDGLYTTSMMRVYGYNSTRGDNPTGTNRPLIAGGAYSFQFDNYWIFKNLRVTSTANYAFRLDMNGYFYNCKSVNNSTSASRYAFFASGGNSSALRCEGISLNGVAFYTSGNYNKMWGCHARDSLDAFRFVSYSTIAFNIAESCDQYGLVPGSQVYIFMLSNTIYNCDVGIRGTTGWGNKGWGNIIDSCTTGAQWTNNYDDSIWDYNNWNNNGTDVSNVTKGDNATAVDPEFTDVAKITGTTATTSSAVLTDAGADFDAVVNDQDYCHITSGTDVTAGVYAVTAHTTTTLTLSPDPGDSAAGDINYWIVTGHDFSVGTNVKATGFPGAFPGALSTGYLDQGAVQREESGGEYSHASVT